MTKSGTGPTSGDVYVSLAEPVMRNRAELEAPGWEVHVLEGADHLVAMRRPGSCRSFGRGSRDSLRSEPVEAG